MLRESWINRTINVLSRCELPRSCRLAADSVHSWASGVRSETIPGYRFTSPVRGWVGPTTPSTASRKLEACPPISPSLKLGGSSRAAPSSGAKRPCLLHLSLLGLIETSQPKESHTVATSPLPG